MGVAVLGGAFDPPHNGHVALAQGAVDQFGVTRLLVRVVAAPGHRTVSAAAGDRLALAMLAFAHIVGVEVALDQHARTVDSLEALGLHEPVFLIGADELASFPTWKEPERVLELARLGVATRPGIDRAQLDEVIAGLSRPNRVELFEIEQLPIASSEIRDRVADGESIAELVPAAVADEIERRGLYRR
ncbi:MAG: nicotinate-nicotinamide nucleotide adenylyltransferase [Gaiellaceae bacterium]